MRKTDRDNEKNSKLKFRVIEFEVEGDDSAIHEGLRSIQAAIARPKGQPVPMKYIAVGSGPIAAPAGPAATEEEAESPQTELTFEGEATEDSVEEQSKPTTTRKSPPRKATPKPLDSLDITSGPMALGTFHKEKAPDSIQRTCLVFIYWLKQYRSIDVITPSHVYTCYHMLGIAPPADIYTPLKDMRLKRKWLEKGEGEGAYTLNLVGKSLVERMGSSKPS